MLSSLTVPSFPPVFFYLRVNVVRVFLAVLRPLKLKVLSLSLHPQYVNLQLLFTA